MPDQRVRTRLRELWREYEGLIGAVLLFGGLALVFLLFSDAPFTLLNYLIALGGAVGLGVLWVAQLLLIGVCLGSRSRWRRRRTIAAAVRRHPGAVFVPGHAGHGMYSLAHERGVLPRGWRRGWPDEQRMVLVVLPDRVEVWVHGARNPLWSVRRVEDGVRVEHVTIQSDGGSESDREELWFDDGVVSAGVAPEYTVRLLLLRDYPALDLERALREIGLSPDDVPRLDRREEPAGTEE
jgi:hypothetical protein